MADKWEIDWYVCTDDDSGKELWRVPKAIGPLAPDHDHWASWHIAGSGEGNDADMQEWLLAAAAPKLLEALKFCRSVLVANPVEMSERMAIEKADQAIEDASKRPPKVGFPIDGD